MTPASSPSAAPTASHAPIATLWKLMAGHRAQYLAAIGALLVANLFAYLAPLIGSATLDLAIAGHQTAETPAIAQRVAALLGGADTLAANLWIGALAMAVLTAASGAFTFLKGWLAALASDGIALGLKNRLYDHLQHLPVRHHDTADTGDLVQRCTSDVETVRMCLSAQVVEVGNAAILALTALPVMLLLNPSMTALSFTLIFPIILFGFIYFKRVKHLFLKVDEAEGRVTSIVQENLTGIRVVRAFARQDHEIGRFATPNADYRDHSLRMIDAMAWYWSLSDLVCLAQNGLVLFGGALLVANGEMTVGTLFAFLAFLNILLWPVRQMGRILTDLGKTSVALVRLDEILAAEPEADPLPGVTASLPLPDASVARGALEFRGVRFAHALAPDGRRVAKSTASDPTVAAPARHALDGVTFTVHAGETLAILGPSGGGKSTLIHLLLRLYDCQSGAITFDGRDIATLPRTWVRGQCGVVMQEPFLYSKSLRENIRIGRAMADEFEVAEAAKLAAVHETITGFADGYETQIGERGITLSGGQRQRVAIARAVLRDPPVLVLDDALSAVDSETESAIIDALEQRRGRRTTLLIAHRLSTLAHADRVVVLEHGRITQIGTHQELVSSAGLYRRLWEIQTRLGDGVAEVDTTATTTRLA